MCARHTSTVMFDQVNHLPLVARLNNDFEMPMKCLAPQGHKNEHCFLCGKAKRINKLRQAVNVNYKTKIYK